MNKKFYTDINNSEFVEDKKAYRSKNDSYVCAIKTELKTKTKYQVRTDAFGDLYNPYNTAGMANVTTFKQSKLKQGPEFTDVSKEVFDLYVDFLNSYRPIRLKLAERKRNEEG